jgi:hypothetical protein
LDTTTVSTHELTHSIFSAAEKSNQGPVIFDPDKAIDELDDFQDQVNAFYFDRSTESTQLKNQKLLRSIK